MFFVAAASRRTLLGADHVRGQVDVAVEDLLDGFGHLRAWRGLGDEAHRAVGDGL